MQHVVMSVTRLKKRQQVLLSLKKYSNLIETTKWYYILPLVLFTITTLPSISLAQGLASQLTSSSAIIQDDKGFIWLSSTNGLIRHDSENNIVFNSNNKNWPLPFNWINDIYPIENDKLLLATETHKLWQFNTSTGIATQLAIDIDENSIYKVIEHLGYYYLFAHDKLYQVNAKSLTVKLISKDIDIRAFKKTNKRLYISTYKGIFKLLDHKLELVDQDSVSDLTTSKNALIIAKGHQLIAINDNGQSQTHTLKHTISNLAIANNDNSVFAVNDLGEIELFSLNDMAKLTSGYPNIKPGFIDRLYHDSAGVLWALTNQGVKKITPLLNKNTPKVFDTSINSLSLTANDEQVFIGSYGGGLHELNTAKNMLPVDINRNFSSQGKVITDVFHYKNQIYISSFDGLWQFDLNNKKLSRVNFPNNNKLLLDMSFKNNKLYLASNDDGVYVYDIASNAIDMHIKGDTLTSHEAINVLPLDNGKVWIATSAGINIYDSNSGKVTDIERLGENKVISLLEYKSKVFVATKGDGFFVYNLAGELLSHFSKNIIFGYMSLINGDIWISGRPGLYRLNPDTYQLTMIANTEQYTFTKKPILLNNKVYAGHYGGVIEVPLTFENTFDANIYISKTIASGRAKLLNDTIEIDSPNDVVTLELASLDFRPGQKKQFKYQINDNQWHDINDKQLTLTGLSPGDYHIEIMGTNSLGQWSDFKAYADIKVAYPWYWHPNSRIIYAVLITVIALLTFWLLYLRSRSISHIHQLLDEEIKTRGKSAAIIRRKLQKVQSLISSNQAQNLPGNSSNIKASTATNDKEQLSIEDKAEARNLITQCLTELNTKHNKAEPSNLSGSSLTVALPYLADYFHQQYHVLVSVQLDIDCEKVEYTIQTAIYRIIYEAILAAINNGNGGVFAVHVNESNDKIWLKITDNEQSFAQFNSKINFDMAMYYIRQVANKFSATFHTYDNQEHGSEIIISIPLMKIS